MVSVGNVVGEADRTGRGQLPWPLMGTVRSWHCDPRVVGSHGRFLNRENHEQIVFRSSSWLLCGESGYKAWSWAMYAVLVLMLLIKTDCNWLRVRVRFFLLPVNAPSECFLWMVVFLTVIYFRAQLVVTILCSPPLFTSPSLTKVTFWFESFGWVCVIAMFFPGW